MAGSRPAPPQRRTHPACADHANLHWVISSILSSIQTQQERQNLPKARETTAIPSLAVARINHYPVFFMKSACMVRR
jgi:hypothetical protein